MSMSENIVNIANGLGELAGRVDGSVWEIVHGIRGNLRVVAAQVRQLETHFTLPIAETPQPAVAPQSAVAAQSAMAAREKRP